MNDAPFLSGYSTRSGLLYGALGYFIGLIYINPIVNWAVPLLVRVTAILNIILTGVLFIIGGVFGDSDVAFGSTIISSATGGYFSLAGFSDCVGDTFGNAYDFNNSFQYDLHDD